MPPTESGKPAGVSEEFGPPAGTVHPFACGICEGEAGEYEHSYQERPAFTVAVLLSEDFARTAFGYDAEAPYRKRFFVAVRANSVADAAETAFAICNSYPGELHCSRYYANAVALYRSGKNRSLSVGDAVEVSTRDAEGKFLTTTRLACESVGFKEVAVP